MDRRIKILEGDRKAFRVSVPYQVHSYWRVPTSEARSLSKCENLMLPINRANSDFPNSRIAAVFSATSIKCIHPLALIAGISDAFGRVSLVTLGRPDKLKCLTGQAGRDLKVVQLHVLRMAIFANN
jgi:hypothetical protein